MQKTNTYISEIDTNRFGIKVAKIDAYKSDPKVLIDRLRDENVRLLISRIDCKQLQLINRLESLGFKLKDIQVTYRYKIENLNFAESSSDIYLRDAEDSDKESLLAIAAEAFLDYGHYAADTKLDRKKSHELYVDWVSRSLNDIRVAQKVSVADMNREVVGFLISQKIEENNSYFSKGVIGAVAEKYRDKNVFRFLVQHGMIWAKKLGLEWVEHNVLITNYPANAALSGIGFKIYTSLATLHLWLE